MQNEERSEPRDSDPYQLACLAAGVGVWDWDLRSDEIYFSSLAREIQGLSQDEPATFATVRSLTHPDDAADMLAALEHALDPENRLQESYVYRITRPDTGELRWVRAHGVARFAEVEGKIQAVHYSGSIEDITEREEMRRALTESEARLRIALDAAQMAVWEIDLESDIVTSSVELNRLYGFPDDAKPAADDFRARYAPGEGERLAKAGAEARASGENKLQTQVRHLFPDGSERVFLLRAALAPVDHTGRERAIGVVFDIT
ncbi:PAS domain-containing protein [Sulfitobacter faviae]